MSRNEEMFKLKHVRQFQASPKAFWEHLLTIYTTYKKISSGTFLKLDQEVFKGPKTRKCSNWSMFDDFNHDQKCCCNIYWQSTWHIKNLMMDLFKFDLVVFKVWKWRNIPIEASLMISIITKSLLGTFTDNLPDI